MIEIENETAGWDQRPTGETEILPLLRWAAAAAPGVVLLRLEIAMETGEVGWVQLALPADQAPDLAKAIQQKAKRALGSQTPVPRRARPAAKC